LHGHDEEEAAEAKARLRNMGVLTGMAIFVHNLPEGLITFFGALTSPKLGFTLAIAVALHNIPEGIAVSAPIYYATGNRRAAFFWGFVSGASEPLGAVIGYLALRTVFSPASFGAIFGLVGGMMTYIVVREALPTAHRYDPKDVWTTGSVFAGMAIMAGSLLLFDL
jgi:ZIP family zinc transporter